MPGYRRAYLVTTFILVTLYFALPTSPRALWTAIGCVSVVAIVVGVRVNRPRHALAWWLVGAGTATFIAGDTLFDVLSGPMGREVPFPSIVDGLYLCTYPLFAGGLLLFVRARNRNRDREALIDALIVAIGVALLVWVMLASPYVQDGSLNAVEKCFSIAYPLGDVLLLAVLARLSIGNRSRSSSLRLLTVGTLGLMASDVQFGLVNLNVSLQNLAYYGGIERGGPVEIGWVVFYVAWGAAALQPDMVELTEPVPDSTRVMSRKRLVLLASVSLVPPFVLLIQALVHDVHDVVVNALASTAIFWLVSMRLSGLVQAARESTQRENVLRRTGESFVGASSREEIYAAGARAISAMAQSTEDHRVLVAVPTDKVPRLVYDSEATDPAAPDGPFVADVEAALDTHGDELRRHRFAVTSSEFLGDALAARLGPDVPVLMAALSRSDAVDGLVVVAGVGVERPDFIDAVCAMTAQMALALESADLTEQVLQRKNDDHFRSLIQNASDMILVVDADLRVTYQTPSVRTVLGREPEDVMGRRVLELLSAADAPPASMLLRRARSAPARDHRSPTEPDAEWRLVDGNGLTRAFEVTCSNLLDDVHVRGLVLTLHETTERRALEERLTHAAVHDALTQLPNRTLFLDRVGHALLRQERHQERLAVMLIDLDDFKLVNDTRGHAAGDALLVAVTKRLRLAVRPEDTCARLGGDEFAVLVEGLESDDEAAQLAARILTGLSEPYGFGDEEPKARASIGLSTSALSTDPAELLMQADLAMYAAKESGKGTHEFYRPALQDLMQSRISKVRDLQHAFDEGQFVLHYQPVVDLPTGTVVGTEALLRWEHPERGLLLPGEFIDVVEQGELAVPLGQWVIETAIAQAVTWQPADGAGPLRRMNVNVAPRQLDDPGFVDGVIAALQLHGLAPAALTLEITERTLTLKEPQVVRSMQRLREIGVGLAVDDFGTGYAALGYLRRFPVSALKIDRSFVMDVETSADDRALVAAIIGIGENLGLTMVAEGIETQGQRETLVALGCMTGQGFLYAPGLPAAQAAAYIADQSASDLDLASLALVPVAFAPPAP
jgi:diguanylate cyclase (GGDEF)-like protein/PAS domain S-box-containing protein